MIKSLKRALEMVSSDDLIKELRKRHRTMITIIQDDSERGYCVNSQGKPVWMLWAAKTIEWDLQKEFFKPTASKRRKRSNNG